MELEVDPAEVYFLILHHLANGPCSQAFNALQQEVSMQSLLPFRTDIFGNQHRMTYEELRQKHLHVPHSMLDQLLSQTLKAKRESGVPGCEGLISLLGAGLLSIGTSLVSHPQQPPQQRSQALPQKLALQQTAGCRGPAAQSQLLQPRLLSSHLKHQKTVRGHHHPVYCLAFDRAGRMLITGSDDRVVKMWSLQTALLRMVCRGHEGEVTDLAVSVDNCMVASSSNDHTIRVWNLQEDALGHPVSVLLGHQGAVSFVDFSRVLPDLLLSSSFDGSCCLWDARVGGAPLHKLHASPVFALPRAAATIGLTNTRYGRAAGPNAHDNAAAPAGSNASHGSQAAGGQPGHDQVGLLVCSFSPDGSYIVAGANDCHCYIWQWDILLLPGKPKDGFYDPAEDRLHPKAPVPATTDLESLPQPVELCRLAGHKNDVQLLQFSHDGRTVATGSRDGSVRVWRRPKRRGQSVRGPWQGELTMHVSPDEEAVAQARRRRRAVPNPSITQIAWSVDDRLVMAAVTDNSVMVWDAHSGDQRARLVGHTGAVHILECHPSDPRLVMTASYDGCTNVWDITTCSLLASFATKDTRPGDSSWADPIQLVDGHWLPDGEGLVVSDAAGQWHLYSTGPGSLYAHARYDQFTAAETWNRLSRDAAGFVLDIDAQLLPHVLFSKDKLTDFMGEPYPAAYQDAWHAGKILQLSVDEAQAHNNGTHASNTPPALVQFPPTLTAAAWQAQEEGGDEEAIAAAVEQASYRAQQADLAASEPQQPEQAVVDVELLPEAEADDDLAAAAPGHAAGVQTRAAAAAEPRMSTRRSRFESLGSDSEDTLGISDEEGEVYGVDGTMSRAARLEMRTRRREEAMEEAGPSRRRTAARGSMPKRRNEDASARPDARKRRRTSRFAYDDDAEVYTDDFDTEDEEDIEEAYDEEEEAGRANRPRRSTAQYSRQRRRAQRSERMQRRDEARRRAGPQAVLRPGITASTGGRPAKAYSWLQESDHRPGVYVPQLGDDVVYIWEGHKLYFDNTHDKRRGPWLTVTSTAADTRGAKMRSIEYARVLGLRYIISDDGQANTLAVLRLVLSDESSPLAGSDFEVELPPPYCGHAEFVVLRGRFDSSLRRPWAVQDACKIFYHDEGQSAQGQWWTGVIKADNLQGQDEAASSELDNIIQLARWERFQIAWDEIGGIISEGDDEGGASNQTPQSVWEMFELSATAASVRRETPSLEQAVEQRTKEAVELCLLNERYSLFAAAPEPEESYPSASGEEMLFYNQIVEVPMSLLIIQARLSNGWYRQPQAVMHDAQLLADNAHSFNGEGSAIAELADGIAARIIAVLEGRDPPVSNTEEAVEQDDTDCDELPMTWAQGRRSSQRRRSRFVDPADASDHTGASGGSQQQEGSRQAGESQAGPIAKERGKQVEQAGPSHVIGHDVRRTGHRSTRSRLGKQRQDDENEHPEQDPVAHIRPRRGGARRTYVESESNEDDSNEVSEVEEESRRLSRHKTRSSHAKNGIQQGMPEGVRSRFRAAADTGGGLRIRIRHTGTASQPSAEGQRGSLRRSQQREQVKAEPNAKLEGIGSRLRSDRRQSERYSPEANPRSGRTSPEAAPRSRRLRERAERHVERNSPTVAAAQPIRSEQGARIPKSWDPSTSVEPDFFSDQHACQGAALVEDGDESEEIWDGLEEALAASRQEAEQAEPDSGQRRITVKLGRRGSRNKR